MIRSFLKFIRRHTNERCLLIEKPQPCEQVCSENRCPLKKNGSVTVTWGAQNEKEETQ